MRVTTTVSSNCHIIILSLCKNRRPSIHRIWIQLIPSVIRNPASDRETKHHSDDVLAAGTPIMLQAT